jgi:hypothetical protein
MGTCARPELCGCAQRCKSRSLSNCIADMYINYVLPRIWAFRQRQLMIAAPISPPLYLNWSQWCLSLFYLPIHQRRQDREESRRACGTSTSARLSRSIEKGASSKELPVRFNGYRNIEPRISPRGAQQSKIRSVPQTFNFR